MHPGIDVISSSDCVNRTTATQMCKAFTRSAIPARVARCAILASCSLIDGDSPKAS